MSMSGHHTRDETTTDEWLTPPFIVEALGPFDLDPCSPVVRQWDTAAKHYSMADDGLWQNWDKGKFIWMNPPYGKHTGDWLERLAEHGNGIALIFARTETSMFFKYVWDAADCVFFIKGRLTFYAVDGTPGKYTSGAPSVLIGYGELATERIRRADFRNKINGKYMRLDNEY